MTSQMLAREVLQRLGLKQGGAMSEHEQIDSDIAPSSISADYEALIVECFRMLGVNTQNIRIGVRTVGTSPGGLDVYAAFVKVVQWDASVVNMLSRMPHIEKKIDRRVKLSSMLRYSCFAGVWFRSPGNLEGIATTVH